MTVQPAFPPISGIMAPTRDLSRARFLIEEVYPSIEQGRFPVKRVEKEPVDVWADVFREGHELVAAALVWRRDGESRWRRQGMRPHDNDRWTGTFVPDEPGRYVFAIEAWTDTFGTWRRDFLLKREAGRPVELEAKEGRELLAPVNPRDKAASAVLEAARNGFDRTGDAEALLSEGVRAAMAEHQPRLDLTRSSSFSLVIDRPIARAGAWYEMFPRSQSAVAGRHGTFDDCIARLPELAELGFDVVYFPPIHPIGRVNRKGVNNSLRAKPGDPGSPYAIGAAEGGHDAIHPELGTFDDFRRLIEACRRHGMEVALDFAIQCAPDHPWIAEHPEWFRRRADGSIRHAENPPKKYEDIVNPDFHCADQIGLWNALRDVVLFWVEHGVRIFRVDNPHTKPFAFWEWLIREVQIRHPGVVFLSEAFTRPKVMKALAKLGFTQSYTYFTWRTAKWELESYLHELTQYPVREYFRPNWRPGDLQVARRVGGDAFVELRHIRWIRAHRAHAHSQARGIPAFGEIRAQASRLEPAREHQGLHRKAQPAAPGEPGAAADREPALRSRGRRSGRRLRQGIDHARQCHCRGDRAQRRAPARILVPFRGSGDRTRGCEATSCSGGESPHRRPV